MIFPLIRLKTTRKSSHPWIFSKMVRRPEKRLQPGTLVEIRTREGRFAGRGFYHPFQTIALRIISQHPDDIINEEFIFRRLEQARILREDVLQIQTDSDSYRLVHAEADQLSGIVIDKFADVIVIEPFCAGVKTVGHWLVSGLRRLYPRARIGFHVNSKLEEKEKISFKDLVEPYPLPQNASILENGLNMLVDFTSGHKTGYFLDQRENRLLVRKLAAGKTLFDLFCYTGGFALSALLGGAKQVKALDLDEKALHLAKKNAALNHLPGEHQSLEWIHMDVFDFLRSKIQENELADMVILDPAKLAGVKDEIPRAMKTYGDLNRLAVQTIKPGGILVSCSCSGLISEEVFKSIVTRSANEANRTLQIFKISGAGPDHPVSTDFPEGKYLKVIYARVGMK
ncbi:MAG: class I SAM-dependent rRNA methyltransferase [Candidatus Aureabacteria bacterium]|nr:class I SAM-dependent rRNA methyltransferase [Candidatus Auribacterota bacterium]